MEQNVLTLAYLLTDTHICLGRKKHGFGTDKWNGYGGKVDEGETVEESAIREIKEESEVTIEEKDLIPVGEITFYYRDKTYHTHIFLVRKWEGEPVETDEIEPKWFRYSEIPYKQMWADDPHWLPEVLRGKRVEGEVWFNEDDDTIKDMKWNFSDPD